MSYLDSFRRITRLRHQAAPLYEERDRYLSHLFDRGTSARRVRIIAGTLVSVVHFLNLHSDSRVTITAIEDAQTQWMESFIACRGRRVNTAAFEDFKRVASNWLRYCGLLVEKPEPRLPYGDLIPNFLTYLRHVRGMRETTVKKTRLHLTRFLCWAEKERHSFSEISLSDVEQYLANKQSAGNKPRSIATTCRVLRQFFHYAEMNRLTQNKIASSIPIPSVRRYDPGPKGPRWIDLRKLIRSCSSKKPSDLRARAILLLLAIYGLRSSEVSNLSLNDIDWHDESFLVHRSKNGVAQRFPLQFEVGDAILKYLKNGRPKCACRNLFITLHTPYRAVPIGSLLGIVSSRMKALGIEAPQAGPRGLRHSCATQLLHKGYSLAEIADFLGHRSTSSVSIYAKPSKSSIRRVSEFKLRGLI